MAINICSLINSKLEKDRQDMWLTLDSLALEIVFNLQLLFEIVLLLQYSTIFQIFFDVFPENNQIAFYADIITDAI